MFKFLTGPSKIGTLEQDINDVLDSVIHNILECIEFNNFLKFFFRN